MTLSELITSTTALLTRSGSNRVSDLDIRTACLQIINHFASLIADIIPDWTNALTFQTDGSDAGKYCKYNGKLYETKVDNNINNAPPSSGTENTYWIEVSASQSAAIPEWAAGIYGPGLVIVFHNHSTAGRGLYVLIEPSRPFASSNIETEITAEQWERLGDDGGGGGTGGSAIDETYADIAAMLADQANQTQDALYFVTDASADATVDAGWAVYQKLVASTAAIGDYRKLSEEESLDALTNGTTLTAGTAVKFDKSRTYGVPTACTGNITLDTTDFRDNVPQRMIHNDASSPTLDAAFLLIAGSYITGVDNYIYFDPITTSKVLVTISHEI